jgi:hypothetical protein
MRIGQLERKKGNHARGRTHFQQAREIYTASGLVNRLNKLNSLEESWDKSLSNENQPAWSLWY